MFSAESHGARIAENKSELGILQVFRRSRMKNSSSKNIHRIALFFFFLLFNYFFMPSPSGGSLKTGAMIGSTPFEPGAMLLLGSALVGLAAWGRKKIGK